MPSIPSSDSQSKAMTVTSVPQVQDPLDLGKTWALFSGLSAELRDGSGRSQYLL